MFYITKWNMFVGKVSVYEQETQIMVTVFITMIVATN